MEEIKVYIVVVLCQLIYGGNNILCKDALNGGMPTAIFAFYRLCFGTLALVPLALLFGRYICYNFLKKIINWAVSNNYFNISVFISFFTNKILNRKNAPQLSWKITAKIFFLALFGYMHSSQFTIHSC